MLSKVSTSGNLRVLQAISDRKSDLQLVLAIEIILSWQHSDGLCDLSDGDGNNRLTDLDVTRDRVHKDERTWHL